MNVFPSIIFNLMKIVGILLIAGYFFVKPMSQLFVLISGICILLLGHYLINVLKARLHMAARRGAINEMQELLAHGYDINLKYTNGMTPLHWATNKGHYDAVAFLLQSGAAPDIQDDVGRTAAKHASQEGHNQIAALIAEWKPRKRS